MDHLPLSDIPILVSSINFLLRDGEFDNLDQICYCYGVEREEIDHIEDAVSSYADAMSPELFDELSSGRASFLHEHTTFPRDLADAVQKMEDLLY